MTRLAGQFFAAGCLVLGIAAFVASVGVLVVAWKWVVTV